MNVKNLMTSETRTCTPAAFVLVSVCLHALIAPAQAHLDLLPMRAHILQQFDELARQILSLENLRQRATQRDG